LQQNVESDVKAMINLLMVDGRFHVLATATMKGTVAQC